MSLGPFELIFIGIIIGVVMAISFLVGIFMLRMRRPRG